MGLALDEEAEDDELNEDDFFDDVHVDDEDWEISERGAPSKLLKRFTIYESNVNIRLYEAI